MKPYLKLFLAIAGSGTLAAALHAGPPTVADVGDPDSFKHGANYLGAASGTVSYGASCSPTPSTSPAPLNDGSQCFVENACPNQSAYDAINIAAIKLPKDATKDIIYPILNFFHDYTLTNSTAAPVSNAFFDYTADITIESDALNDPSCIDPTTSTTCGGKLTFQFADNRMREERSMNPGDRQRGHLNYTRAGNLGITKRSLADAGIPQPVVDNLFHSTMTVRLNARITARCLDPLSTTGRITCNMRLFGD
jgi:hypothetical protein